MSILSAPVSVASCQQCACTYMRAGSTGVMRGSRMADGEEPLTEVGQGLEASNAAGDAVDVRRIWE